VSEDGDGNLRPGGGGTVDADEIRLRARGAASAALGYLARGTGGALMTDSNDVRNAFGRVGSDFHAHYTLAYVSDNDTEDGAFRRIEVRTKRAGATVRSRSGYVVPTRP
jgi:VWFA-related protein